MEYILDVKCNRKYSRKKLSLKCTVTIFTKHLYSLPNTWCTVHNTFLNCTLWIGRTEESETMWEVCVIQIHSNDHHIQLTAHRRCLWHCLWELTKKGRVLVDRLTTTGVAGLNTEFCGHRLHARHCLVTAQSFLPTSGTFLSPGQTYVYFQGAVFFPGPSWPPSKGFWQRSTLHKRPEHSSYLCLIPSVSSC